MVRFCDRAEVRENASIRKLAGSWIPQSGHSSLLELWQLDDTGTFQAAMTGKVTKNRGAKLGAKCIHMLA